MYYNEFLKNFKHTDKHSYKWNEPHLTKYINAHQGHIITGNINIVTNFHLRSLMHYGTKCRIHSQSHLSTIHTLFVFVYLKLVISYNKPTEYFSDCKHEVIILLQQLLQISHVAKKSVSFSS